jgi:hypothetical protein
VRIEIAHDPNPIDAFPRSRFMSPVRVSYRLIDALNRFASDRTLFLSSPFACGSGRS